MILELIQVRKVKWYIKQFSVKGLQSNTCLLLKLDMPQTSELVMVSVVRSIPTGGSFVAENLKTHLCKFRLEV